MTKFALRDEPIKAGREEVKGEGAFDEISHDRNPAYLD
jgi:hypothetical protein